MAHSIHGCHHTRRHSAGGFFFPAVLTACLAAAALLAPACDRDQDAGTGQEVPRPVRPITEVIGENAPRLMKIAGVAGVYEGVDDQGRPRIVVMIGEEKPRPVEGVPAVLEGYPVLLEFGGEIRPLR